jgi:predicted Rossmann fold flavoprotein
MDTQDVVVIGAGAAGCFSALLLGELYPSLKITILEKTMQPLSKVKISGGGRCNVTHHCFEVDKLIQNYPRGSDFLRSAFHKFQPQDMVRWCHNHGIALKTEKDGRMFPTTDSSQTIIDSFLRTLHHLQIPLLLQKEVVKLTFCDTHWDVLCKDGANIQAKEVLFATGGLSRSYAIIQSLGHSFSPPIPSLFTFELSQEWVKELSGSCIALARVSLDGFKTSFKGPVLFTHWGVSGPAILRLSAFAAIWLFDRKYQATLHLNWTGLDSEEAVREALYQERKKSSEKKVGLTPLFSLSKKLWKAALLQVSASLEARVWAHLSKQELLSLAKVLYQTSLTIVGKSLNKEEFVTCGGICLDELHPKTLESKKFPGLYFAGEVLDIDGVTGGFNFQNAWTSAWIVSQAISQKRQTLFSSQ